MLAELRTGDAGPDPAGLITRAIQYSHGKLDPALQNALMLLVPFTAVPRRRPGPPPGRTAAGATPLGETAPTLTAPVLNMLHAADFGITDAHTRSLDPKITERLRKALQVLNVPDDESMAFELSEESLMSVTLGHRGARKSVEFEVNEESLGTLVWLGLVGPVLNALSDGKVILVDEIESSLHPGLVAQLINTFQDKSSNPNGAQLIFNSHEASLLGDSTGERILGRDQVWFTEKLYDGRTRLYPLTDLNPRKDEAISRRYLAGRYGATPIVSNAEFAALASAASAGGKQK